MGFSQNLGWEMGIGSPLQGPQFIGSLPVPTWFKTYGHNFVLQLFKYYFKGFEILLGPGTHRVRHCYYIQQ